MSWKSFLDTCFWLSLGVVSALIVAIALMLWATHGPKKLCPMCPPDRTFDWFDDACGTHGMPLVEKG